MIRTTASFTLAVVAACAAAAAGHATPRALAFEPNQGQAEPSVCFLARGARGVVTVDASGFAVHVDVPRCEATFAPGTGSCERPRTDGRRTIRLAVVGADGCADVVGDQPLPGRVSYLRGQDPGRWHRAIPTFGSVSCRGILPGVDLVLHSRTGVPEHDFVVAPGADPASVRLRIEGTDVVEACEDSSLALLSGAAILRLRAPFAWQEGATGREPVACRFVLPSPGEIAFDIGPHDPVRALVIDPVIDWATYLGGTDFDEPHGVATDAAGNVYVVGRANSTDFPTQDPIQRIHGGDIHDVFVSKLDPTGSTLIWSTFLGGSGADIGTGIAVSPSGAVVLAGYTASGDFPIVAEVQGANAGIWDAFAASIDPSGTVLVYSTYLGGALDDYAGGVAMASDGGAIVAGATRSTDFPTSSPLQPANAGDFDLFVTRLHPSGALAWSTYLGGMSLDGRFSEVSVATGPGDAAVVVAESDGFFPTTPGVLEPVALGGTDVVVASLLADGSRVDWATYLGGSDLDTVSFLGNHVAVAADGTAWVTGRSVSPDFPIVGLPAPGVGGRSDVFVAGVRPGGASLAASTRFGGSSSDVGQGIALTSAGLVRVTGYTLSPDFPTVAPLQATKLGIVDAVLAEIDPGAGVISFSSYLGGTDDDYGNTTSTGPGDAWIFAGYTTSPDFGATAGSFQPFLSGPADAFVGAFAGCPDAVPPEVSLLRVDKLPLATMHFSWIDVPVATSYEIHEDLRPNGGFASTTGSAPDGAIGLSIPFPPDPLVFYLVRAVNGCAVGALR